MGAGCYYTNPETKELAYWVENPREDNYPDYEFLQEIGLIAEECGWDYADKNCLKFENGLLNLEFQPTYYGDGLVIIITPKYQETQHLYNLGMATISPSEKKLARAINKYYSLFYATSGHTANEIKKGEFK